MNAEVAAAAVSNPDDDYGAWYLGCAVALFIAYLVIFLTTWEQDLWRATTAAAANVAPAATLGLLVRPFGAPLMRQRLVPRLWLFTACAIAFAGAWYMLLAVSLGISLVLQGRAFDFVFLSGPGLVWQIYQGLVIFALIVCATALHDARRPAPAAPDPRRTILVNTDDGLAPLALADIVAIEAADDQSIVHLRGRAITVRKSLNGWADLIEEAAFVRVHRSWLVNIDAAHSIEPVGGGRMVAHLPAGLSAPVSRSGAQQLRARAA